MLRSPELLFELATALDVQNNFAFLPHRRLLPVQPGTRPAQVINLDGFDYEPTNTLTLCNAYTSVFTAALGCAIPPTKANQQKAWLRLEGQAAGWFECNRTAALQRASAGYPVVMVAYDQPHGHIGVVMPSPLADPATVYVSAAGRTNVKYGKALASFGPVLDKLALFFTHN